MDTTTTDPAEPASGTGAGLCARDVMTRDVVTVSGATTLGEAMSLLRTLSVRHLPVLADGRLVGLVDDRLVAFALLAASGFGEALERPVSSIMTQYLPQVPEQTSLQHVAHLLGASLHDAIVVIDAQEHLLGLITTVDVVRVVASGGRAPDRAGAGGGPAAAEAPAPPAPG